MAAACAPRQRYTTAALAGYDEYRPFVDLTGSGTMHVELDRAGYVSILSVYADHLRPDVPVDFVPWYPVHVGEESYFGAGRQRVRYGPPPAVPPPACAAGETPTLAGCRAGRWYAPPYVPAPEAGDGIGERPQSWNRPRFSRTNYLVVVTQTPADPYTLADDLYHAAREDRTLDRLLRAHDAPAAAPVLERALLDRRGPIVLAGLYVTMVLSR